MKQFLSLENSKKVFETTKQRQNGLKLDKVSQVSSCTWEIKLELGDLALRGNHRENTGRFSFPS